EFASGQGFCCTDAPQNAPARAPSANDNPELFQYYYHSDHLGSTSLITDLDGNVVQHVEYVPFGEVFIEERNNTWNTPYLFNAKELDEETGLYYYGARYYEPRISQWMSADPMHEKYPGVSSYAYCVQNPVRFIDPDGRMIVLPKGTSTKNIYLVLGKLQKLTNDRLVYSTQKDGTIRIKVASLGKGNKTTGTNLIRDLNSSKRTVTISIGTGGNSETDVNSTNAINGVGSDANVTFNPTANPPILTKDPKTGNVSGASRPNEIGLGHELIHADKSMKGKAVDYSTTATHTYKDATGNTVTQTMPKEELETVGLMGNHKYNENKLRKEQGLNERGAY
ncbi:MAG: hypothetical protein LBS01_02580, partial [Prevotellaceae bacterium]|nr:hypothetical protein [Prevotellaceae bacterium]